LLLNLINEETPWLNFISLGLRSKIFASYKFDKHDKNNKFLTIKGLHFNSGKFYGRLELFRQILSWSIHMFYGHAYKHNLF
jgi:hypothetical protein